MKNITVALIVLALVIGGGFAIFYFYGTSIYDGAVGKQEEVDKAWGNVQGAYQRRADLIGNLVSTVKGAAETEKDILVQVTQARQGITSATTPEQLDQNDAILRRGLSILIERYPELKSIQNFQMLQVELAGTENRINTERNRYNESVAEFNKHVRGFWRSKALSFVSSADDDFSVRKPFEAREGSEDAPVVDFSTETTPTTQPNTEPVK
jgi:LemA protein